MTRWAAIPWDKMLAADGLTRKTAQLNADRWRGGGPDSLPLFDALWDNWFLVVPTGDRLGRAALQDNSVENAARAVGVDLSDTLVGTTQEAVQHRAQAPGDLADAIAAVQNACAQPLTPAQMTALRQQAAGVPPRVAAAASLLLYTSQWALVQRNLAFTKIAPPDQLQPFFNEALAFAGQGQLTPAVIAHLESIDQHHLFLGALELQDAMRAARELLQVRPPAPKMFHFTWDTPLGKIALNGDGSDTYGPADYLLIIDTGGGDTFAAGAGTPDAAHPISLLLDMGGNNTYHADQDAFGAGILGYGFLYDGGSHNHYSIISYGEACGVCGVGVLEDAGGQSSFQSIEQSQAAGTWGLGLLTEGGGHTTYDCYANSQGYGATRGAGLLADIQGYGTFTSNDTDIKYPADQDARHNTNMSQGVGNGRRGAFPGGDGLNLAGGLGLLANGGGHSHYSGGVFCQACAYWYGLGFLVDLGGDNTYRGADYTQGACAHYSVASLIDEGGNNQHTVVDDGQALGHGRDNSIGVLFSAQGNDSYNGPQVPIGWGNNQDAIGIHVDLGGSNVYKTGPLAYTNEGTANTLGLFYAGGSANQLPTDPLAKPNSLWVRKPTDGSAGIAVGMAGSP
jgi:hypothetical protein